MNNMLFKE